MAEQVLAPPAAPLPAPPRPGRTLLLWAVAGLGAVLLAVALAGAAPQPVPAGLPDPGPLPGWGLPLVRAGGRAASLVVVGTLLLALLERRSPRRSVVALAAAVWALTAVVELLLGLAEVVALPLPQLLQGDLLRYWLLETAQGRGQALAAVGAVLVALAAPLCRSRATGALLLVVALGALVPPLLAGHAATAGNHRLAQAALVVHVLAAALWVGGVGALALAREPSAAARFSPLALACAIGVTASGLGSAWLRLPGWSGLSSGYGVLLLLKTALLVLVVLAGARHRARTLPALAAGRPGAFRRLVVVESVLLALVVGLAVALSRTPPA